MNIDGLINRGDKKVAVLSIALHVLHGWWSFNQNVFYDHLYSKCKYSNGIKLINLPKSNAHLRVFFFFITTEVQVQRFHYFRKVSWAFKVTFVHNFEMFRVCSLVSLENKKASTPEFYTVIHCNMYNYSLKWLLILYKGIRQFWAFVETTKLLLIKLSFPIHHSFRVTYTSKTLNLSFCACKCLSFFIEFVFFSSLFFIIYWWKWNWKGKITRRTAIDL